jgi:hypothetical protein
MRASRVQAPHASRIHLRPVVRAAPVVSGHENLSWTYLYRIIAHRLLLQANAAAVEAKVDWSGLAEELDTKSPLEIMDKVCFMSRHDQQSNCHV